MMSKNLIKDIETNNINMSKNTLKEIKTNKIIMSKNNIKNEIINNNIDYSNMSKNIKLKLASLEGLAKKVKNENKIKADNIVQLYKDRKISQATTAEKLIINFIEYDNLKDRRKKTIDKNYDKIISKYENAEPLNERMRTGSKYIQSIEIKGEDKAKTEIIYNIKNVEYERKGLKLFINLHNSIYNKLYKDVKPIVEKKVSFKVQTVCQYIVKDTIISKFISSRGASSSVDSLDDTLQSQKIEVRDKIEIEFESDPIALIEKIIIVVYQTKNSRGSSYIPTPLPYNSPSCGLINIKNEDDKCFYWCVKYHSSKQEKTMID